MMRKKWWIAGGVLVAVILLMLVLGIERGNAPGWVLFFGRFHPVVVHFPIALLLLGAAIELLAPVFARVARVRSAVTFILATGGFAALVAVILGHMLSLAGGYDERLLALHLRLGLVVTVLAFGLAVVSAWLSKPGKVYRWVTGAFIVLIVLAGHFGGSLARGSGYLVHYLPDPLKDLIGARDGAPEGLIANVDSARVYVDIVQPILDRRCITCHGPSKSKGDLRLDSQEGIERGGRNGPAYVAGYPSQSEIVRRVALPPYDEDAMPPDGSPPLDIGETEVIRWWIEHGASFEMTVSEVAERPTAVTTFLARVSEPREPRLSGIYALDVAEADTNVIAGLQDRGWIVSRIDPTAPFLYVSAASLRGSFADADLEVLLGVADQVATLDVGHAGISDEGAAVVASMPHLVALHLEGTRVGDAALQHLADLKHLEYLNLYGTGVSDAGLEHLRDLPVLRTVYLWQSEVSEAAARAFRDARPDVEVNVGNTLALVADTTVITPGTP